MNFRKVNNITGWVIGLIACATYILTREATGSFWDCGEFVSSAYKLQLPHPPGAPVFVLLGRLFIIVFGDNPEHAAQAVNLMSALASGFTILFLFWTITHFARKMFVNVGEEMTSQQIFTVMSAGTVGALAYCFSDSFWFSAVEGEVYGLSSFFTALVFWAMLKWEHTDEKAGTDEAARNRADRWIVFIFFAMGLSIGVHLLGLLTIPAIVMIYYFRRYQYTFWGAVLAFGIGCLITGLVQVVIIQYSMKAAGIVDIFAVNDFHFGFFSGFTFYFLIVAALIVIGLRFKNNKVSKLQLSLWLAALLVMLFLPVIKLGASSVGNILKLLLIAAVGFIAYFLKPGSLKGIKLALWCYAFMMLGYSMYVTTLIRSNANPAIDMNNVDNPMSLVYYLSREQYGEAPLVFGPHFLADYKLDSESPNGIDMQKGEMKYVKGKNRYTPIGTDDKPNYQSSDIQLFPRVWDPSDEQDHAKFYISWLNLDVIRARQLSMIDNAQPYYNGEPGFIQTRDQNGKTDNYSLDDNYALRVQRGQVVNAGDVLAVKKPSYGDNMQWFFTYQMGLMYWRYFMWNFAGKQNDVQGLGNVRDGNWITGLPFVDNPRLGDQGKMPDSSKNNKAHNELYLLPFLLGILGCVYQFLQNKKDWIVTFLLFFMTGIAVVIYLNQPGNQPRERDYAYVGSFYAFAIWIGLAVPALFKLIREKQNKLLFNNTILYGAVLTFFIGLMSACFGTMKGAFISSLAMAALFAVFTAALVFLVRAISSAGQNVKIINIAAALVCAITPIIMAQQEWNDHDRSKKRLASDVARDYLQSCAPNTILFTFGDNDTYPLWYAQEVEGVRPDIRIINNSLLGIDWYINQLRYKINQSDPIDVVFSPEEIEGHKREYLRYNPDQNINQNTFYPIDDVMKVLRNEKYENYFPVKKFKIPVDTAFARKNGVVNARDTILSEIQFELPKGALYRSDLVILSIISANKWKRPICFTSPYGQLGFGDYLRKDGLTYRLVPVKVSNPADNWMIRTYMRPNNIDFLDDNLLHKFVYTSKNGVYFDEENRRHSLILRSTYAEGAGNSADIGKKDVALQIIQKADSLINGEQLPYAMISRNNDHNISNMFYLEASYKAGNLQLAEKVKQALKKDLQQQKNYYDYLRNNHEEIFGQFDGQDGDAARNEFFLQLLDMMEQKYNPKAAPPPIETKNPTLQTNIKPDTSKPKNSTKKDSNK